MATLATYCGVSDRQIQRAINRLVRSKLIDRTKRRSQTGIRATNAYDLRPLVAILNEVAKAFPNDFPRNVDRSKVKEISSLLGDVVATVHPAVMEVSFDDHDEPISA